jgi:CRISPR type III-B/RAMP module RAMP protein Cmr6
LKADNLIFAQLQSRLMVNMAGGVMENAGLCLDRFGLPYIPGSAVKGCARRLALAALREWCETVSKPGENEADKANLLADACKPFTSPATMLAAIARVFGWGAQDWKTRADFRSDEDWEKKRPDFAWACGDDWETTRAEVLKLLRSAPAPGALAPNSKDFAGSISFLPAYPVDLGKTGPVADLPLEVPALGELELDVVTVHHKRYYAGPEHPENPASIHAWESAWGTAPDIEEPVPNVFPAVAAGHVFAFALAPLRRAEPTVVEHARTWLACGLSTFGVGAKTAAGYGWFADVTDSMRRAQDVARAQQAEQERQHREQSERDAARASLQPDPALLEKLRGMKEPDLRGEINPFATEERFWTQKDERVQLTVLHFLLVTAPDLLAADRANPRSKIAKAIANLAAKFPHVASLKP